jgi:hypothetical protein
VQKWEGRLLFKGEILQCLGIGLMANQREASILLGTTIATSLMV